MFIFNDENKSFPIHFKSYKARHAVPSVLGGKLIAFSDSFDNEFSLAPQFLLLLPSSPIPSRLFTDRKSLSDVISKWSRTSERHLPQDIACAHEGFRRHEISDIGFIWCNDNLPDDLTKWMSQSALGTVMNESLTVIQSNWSSAKILKTSANLFPIYYPNCAFLSFLFFFLFNYLTHFTNTELLHIHPSTLS